MRWSGLQRVILLPTGPLIGEVLTTFIRGHAPWPPSLPGQYVAMAPISQVPKLQTRAPDVQASLWVLGRGGFADALGGEHWLDLTAIDLRRADLRDARLGAADLRFAALQRAYLGGAYLEGAHLEGSDLEDARLAGAYLLGAAADEQTRWPSMVALTGGAQPVLCPQNPAKSSLLGFVWVTALPAPRDRATIRQRSMTSTAGTFVPLTGRSPQLAERRRHGLPVTVITITRCDWRRGTDVRYPPSARSDESTPIVGQGTTIGSLCTDVVRIWPMSASWFADAYARSRVFVLADGFFCLQVACWPRSAPPDRAASAAGLGQVGPKSYVQY